MLNKIPCTAKQLAAALELSERRISELTRVGTFRRPYELLVSVKAYIVFLRQDSGSLKVERTRCAKLKADLLQLDYRLRAGELIELAAAQAEWFKVARTVRDRFLAMPSRLSGILSAERSQHEVFARLSKEIHEILTELAGHPTTGKKPDDSTEKKAKA